MAWFMQQVTLDVFVSHTEGRLRSVEQIHRETLFGYIVARSINASLFVIAGVAATDILAVLWTRQLTAVSCLNTKCIWRQAGHRHYGTAKMRMMPCKSSAGLVPRDSATYRSTVLV